MRVEYTEMLAGLPSSSSTSNTSRLRTKASTVTPSTAGASSGIVTRRSVVS